jgi:hypothetical protein
VGAGRRRDARPRARSVASASSLAHLLHEFRADVTHRLLSTSDLLPLPSSGPCDPRAVIVFGSVAAALETAQQGSDPFSSGAAAGGGPFKTTLPAFVVASQAQSHALLLTLISFLLALLAPVGQASDPTTDPGGPGGAVVETLPAAQHFPWLAQSRTETVQLFLTAWNDTASASVAPTATSARAATTRVYVRLARAIGPTQLGVWTKLLELVKGRCKEDLEDGHMDIDDGDDGPSSQTRRLRAEVDRELYAALHDLQLGVDEQADCINGLSDLAPIVRFLELGDRDTDLAVCQGGLD